MDMNRKCSRAVHKDRVRGQKSEDLDFHIEHAVRRTVTPGARYPKARSLASEYLGSDHDFIGPILG